MPRNAGFNLPITPPTAREAAALAHAAAYLRRAATEIESRRLGRFGSSSLAPVADDLATQLSSAGSICEIVGELV